MPRDIQEVVKRGVNRDDFIRGVESKASRRRPTRTRVKVKGTLFAIRNKRLAIREAALRKVQIAFTYKKITTNKSKKYIVAPYEFKYRRLKIGVRKMLYAYDMEAKHIKSFALKNIRNVALTDRKFRPKWPILIT